MGDNSGQVVGKLGGVFSPHPVIEAGVVGQPHLEEGGLRLAEDEAIAHSAACCFDADDH